MAVDPNILLQGRGIDLNPALNAFERIKQQRIQNERQAAQDAIQNQLLQANIESVGLRNDRAQQEQVIRDGGYLGSTVLGQLNAGQPDQALAFLQRQKPYMTGASRQMVDDAIAMIQSGDSAQIDQLKQLAGNAVQVAQQFGQMQSPAGQQQSVSQREFDSKIARLQDPNVSDVEKKAIEIDLGLRQRAIGSAAQTIAESGTAEKIAKTQETIKEGEATGTGRGQRRQKDIASISDQIGGIDRGLSNMNRAIKAIDEGAETGRVANLFPSINAATIELQQILGEETLNQLSSVTLGAISESELSLLKETAIPTNMNEDELKDYLQRKQEALKKARKVAVEQLRFLRDGGTREEFILSKAGNQAQPQGNKIGRFTIIEAQ